MTKIIQIVFQHFRIKIPMKQHVIIFVHIYISKPSLKQCIWVEILFSWGLQEQQSNQFFFLILISIKIQSTLLGVLYSVSRCDDISYLTKRSKHLFGKDLTCKVFKIYLAKTEPQEMYHRVLSQSPIERIDYYQSEM